MSSNPDLFDQIAHALFGLNGTGLLNPNQERECLEGYYLNPHDFRTWRTEPGPYDHLKIPTGDESSKFYSKDRFVEEVRVKANQVLGYYDLNDRTNTDSKMAFPIHDNLSSDSGTYGLQRGTHNDFPGRPAHDVEIKYAYTNFGNSKWFSDTGSPGEFTTFEKFSEASNLPERDPKTMESFLKNLSREVPASIERLEDWLGDFSNPDGGILKDILETYATFEQKFQDFEKKAQDFLNISMYNSQEVKFLPDIRAFFTSYVPDDIGYQFQEIRTTDGRMFFRTLLDGGWSTWSLGSPDKTKTSSIELTSGDIGSVPLGNQGGSYSFNVLLEAMKPGEVLYCLTRDVTLSGLPESLRYGSVGYRNTPDVLLNDPTKGYFPNSMGCYGLFDPQNDINEPDSNGIMEIMPSTELFSDEIPRPIMEQQRGWLETKYDGLYYFQHWTPLSPTNSNWCDELDTPRYVYYRKGTLQIADSIYGSKPFIKWTKWRSNHNIETIVDWGEVTPQKLAEKMGRRSLETTFSILSLSSLYDQPIDTTYMWTIKDEGNYKYSSPESDGIHKDYYQKNTSIKKEGKDRSGQVPAVWDKKDPLSTMIVGIPSIRDEGGPPLKSIEDNIYGPFLMGNRASPRRKSIFSRLTSIRTKDIIYYEWRDLGQIYRFKQVDGKIEPQVEELDFEDSNSHNFPSLDGNIPLGKNFFSLKEKSSDFSYYREGRVISKQDLTALPEKVYQTYSKWTPWHSVDERLKSIESRVNFMETLQGLAPASNFSYIPLLSRSLTTKYTNRQGNDVRPLPGVLSFMEKLNSSRSAQLGQGIMGEYSPLYYLRYGYNFLIDQYDTPKSFWGDWINYVHIGRGSTREMGNFIDPYLTEREPEKLKYNGLDGGVNISHSGFRLPITSRRGVPYGQSYDLINESFWWIGAAMYRSSRTIGAIVRGLLIAQMTTGLIGAPFAPLILVNGIITAGSVVLVIGYFDDIVARYNAEAASYIPKQMREMWSPAYTPLSRTLGTKVRRLDFDNPSPDMNDMIKIDTSLWGWMNELKRRTDVIKFLETAVNLALGYIGQCIAVFDVNFMMIICGVLPVAPSTGVQPIPFFTIGLPGATITGFGWYWNQIHYVPYRKEATNHSTPFGTSEWDFHENALKSFFEEGTYEDREGYSGFHFRKVS